MTLKEFGLEITGTPRTIQREMKQLTLLEFGLAFLPHPNQKSLLDFQKGELHD